MKQLSLFEECSPPLSKAAKRKVWKLFIDGASRGNPGQAGAGMCLVDQEDHVIKKRGWFLKNKTNNQAEYLALLLGIYYSKKVIDKHDALYIMADSELLIKQMTGVYRVKNPEIKKLNECAWQLLADMHYSFCHVRRELNVIADAMANEGIDKKHFPSQEFIAMLENNEINL